MKSGKITDAVFRKASLWAKLAGCLLAFGLLLSLSGCSAEEPVKLVLTTGFYHNEIFRLEDASCTLPELMVYLTTEQNTYEAVYGAQIWEVREGEETLSDKLKSKVLAEISQIQAMTLLADRRGIQLTPQEEETVAEAAADYFSSLNDREIEAMGVNRQLIGAMYRDYALADKVYRQIISDINPEISDDEARTITVQHILIKTVTENADGTVSPYSEEEKARCYRRAQEVLRAAREGEAFEALIEKYSDDSQVTLSFGKGEQEQAFAGAAFELGNDEISGIIETSRGYEIIKCISTFNREETDRNKLKIVEKRKDEVFGQEYDSFVNSLAKNLNEPLWDSVELIHDEEVTTNWFFAVYKEYFGQQ